MDSGLPGLMKGGRVKYILLRKDPGPVLKGERLHHQRGIVAYQHPQVV